MIRQGFACVWVRAPSAAEAVEIAAKRLGHMGAWRTGPDVDQAVFGATEYRDHAQPWAFADPADAEGWSGGQVERIGALLPHLRQFVRVRQALAGAKALGASMTALLGLTPQESRLALALAEGRTVRDVAREWGRSEHTLRWHRQHIYAKLGVHRQADLARMPWTLVRTISWRPATTRSGRGRTRTTAA